MWVRDKSFRLWQVLKKTSKYQIILCLKLFSFSSVPSVGKQALSDFSTVTLNGEATTAELSAASALTNGDTQCSSTAETVDQTLDSLVEDIKELSLGKNEKK